MAGVKNCLNYYQDSEILKCYEDNLNMIVNMSGNGDSVSSELKKQLVQDFCKLSDQRINGKENCSNERNRFENYCKVEGAERPQTLDKRKFQSMIDSMRSCLQNQYRAYNDSQKQIKK